MSALPDSTTATAPTSTEGDLKNFLTGMRDFLSGLLGTSGDAADARAALGLAGATVSSFNTRTGTVTLVAADITAAGGSLNTHNHADANTAGNATTYPIGTTLLAGNGANVPVTNATISVYRKDAYPYRITAQALQATALAGTWRVKGYDVENGGTTYAILVQRTA